MPQQFYRLGFDNLAEVEVAPMRQSQQTASLLSGTDITINAASANVMTLSQFKASKDFVSSAPETRTEDRISHYSYIFVSLSLMLYNIDHFQKDIVELMGYSLSLSALGTIFGFFRLGNIANSRKASGLEPSFDFEYNQRLLMAMKDDPSLRLYMTPGEFGVIKVDRMKFPENRIRVVVEGTISDEMEVAQGEAEGTPLLGSKAIPSLSCAEKAMRCFLLLTKWGDVTSAFINFSLTTYLFAYKLLKFALNYGAAKPFFALSINFLTEEAYSPAHLFLLFLPLPMMIYGLMQGINRCRGIPSAHANQSWGAFFKEMWPLMLSLPIYGGYSLAKQYARYKTDVDAPREGLSFVHNVERINYKSFTRSNIGWAAYYTLCFSLFALAQGASVGMSANFTSYKLATELACVFGFVKAANVKAWWPFIPLFCATVNNAVISVMPTHNAFKKIKHAIGSAFSWALAGCCWARANPGKAAAAGATVGLGIAYGTGVFLAFMDLSLQQAFVSYLSVLNFYRGINDLVTGQEVTIPPKPFADSTYTAAYSIGLWVAVCGWLPRLAFTLEKAGKGAVSNAKGLAKWCCCFSTPTVDGGPIDAAEQDRAQAPALGGGSIPVAVT